MPGTSGLKIDSRTLSFLIAYYLSNTAVDGTPPETSQTTINTAAFSLINELRQDGFQPPSFSVKGVSLVPSGAVTQETALFGVQGTGVRDIQVKVSDLDGNSIFTSPATFGSLLEWRLTTASGRVPDGIYSYTTSVTGFGGETYTSPEQQLIIKVEDTAVGN